MSLLSLVARVKTPTGIWRCAMPKAPRQLPSLPPPNRANPTGRANSGLADHLGASEQGRNLSASRLTGDYRSRRLMDAVTAKTI